MNAPQSNRRVYPRLPIRVGAELQLPAMELTCATRNLSLGGVGMVLDRAVPEGALTMVSLYLVVDDVEDTDAEPLELAARVVWCRATGPETYEAGLQFQESTEAQRRRLAEFLAIQERGGL